MKNVYDEITSKMDLSGLKTLSWEKIEKLNKLHSKQDLAKFCIPKDITFDYALPIYFLDAIGAFFGDQFDYKKFVGTSFALYSDERNINCLIWSGCKEQNDLIVEFLNRKG